MSTRTRVVVATAGVGAASVMVRVVAGYLFGVIASVIAAFQAAVDDTPKPLGGAAGTLPAEPETEELPARLARSIEYRRKAGSTPRVPASL